MTVLSFHEHSYRRHRLAYDLRLGGETWRAIGLALGGVCPERARQMAVKFGRRVHQAVVCLELATDNGIPVGPATQRALEGRWLTYELGQSDPDWPGNLLNWKHQHDHRHRH